jgi:hypothetical protein
MPNVNKTIRLLTKDSAWHTTNASLILGLGRVIFLSGTNPMRFKIGDGVTELATLKFYDEMAFIIKSEGPDAHRWQLKVDDTGQFYSVDLGV